jgi:ribonuclease HII
LRNRPDQRLWKLSKLLCGVDEVGRGPLAGPVVAAAVVLPPYCSLPGVNDSKLLSPKRRAVLFDRILECALSWSVGVVNHRRIDRVNIRNASFESMKLAIWRLAVRPDYALVDGFRIPGLALPHEGIIGGDGKSLSIAAASIIAKVTRDRMMEKFHARYPGYGFDHNKGYGTPGHLAALERLGPSPIHRRTFAPVKQLRFELKTSADCADSRNQT